MGNSSSSEEDLQKVGYRVLGVQANSPAAKGGLVSFFDFIVQANGIPLRVLDSTFIDLIKAFEDKPLPLQIYNWKNKSFREITLVPSRNWPGEGMLGVTIRFDSYKDAEEQMLHVLEVETNSPAELAGLLPYKDYLLGTAEKAFTDAEVLQQELADHLDRPVEFYVYNTESDEVRVVVIMPTSDWGADGDGGILGANVAYGYLHLLPAHCCETIGKSNESEANRSVSSPFGQNYSYPAGGGIEGNGTTIQEVNSTGVHNAEHHIPAATVPLTMPTMSHANPHTTQQQQHQQHITHTQQQPQQQVSMSHDSIEHTEVTNAPTGIVAQSDHSVELEASNHAAPQPISS